MHRLSFSALATLRKPAFLLLVALLSSILAMLVLHLRTSHPAPSQPNPSAQATLAFTDSVADGTPDFLRLDDPADQQAFRLWFTFLAEVQYFNPPASRPPEIVDCAALIRYAYREALHRHDGAWAASALLPLIPAIASVAKYDVPHTPLGPALFRVRAGVFNPPDLRNGAFAQFADAATINRFNTFFISRDVNHAERGDLFFFRRDTAHMPFHSMIFLGLSQVDPSGHVPFVVYDTGPTGTNNGQIRRLTLDQLLHYPDPQWQPRATNPSFLGVFRWNILNTSS